MNPVQSHLLDNDLSESRCAPTNDRPDLLQIASTRRSASGRMLGFALIWSTLAVFLPLALADVPGDASPFSVILQWLVLAYASARIAMLLATGRPRWLDALFWTFAYIWIALAGFVQLIAGTNPYGLAFGQSSYQTAAVLAIVGMACYDVGLMVGSKLLRGRPRSVPSRVLDTKRAIALGVLALLVTPVLVTYLGGWGALFLTRADRWQESVEAGLRSQETGGTTAIAMTLMIAVPLVALLAIMRLIQAQPNRRRRAGWLLLVMALLLLVLVVANPISSSRYWAGTAYMAIVLSTIAASRSKGFRAIFMATFTVLLVLFPYTDYFRRAGTHTQWQSMQSIIVTKADYDTAPQMVNVIDFVNQLGHTYGRQLLGAALFFVPRLLWPEKPGSTGALLADFAHHPYSNVSSPLWVESFIDGGWLGVVLVFMAFGAAASWLQSRHSVPDKGQVTLQALLLPPVAAYSLIILRGSLMSVVGGMVAILAIAWLLSRPRKVLVPSHDFVRGP